MAEQTATTAGKVEGSTPSARTKIDHGLKASAKVGYDAIEMDQDAVAAEAWGKGGQAFDNLMELIEAEAEAEGPEAVVGLRSLEERYRGMAADKKVKS